MNGAGGKLFIRAHFIINFHSQQPLDGKSIYIYISIYCTFTLHALRSNGLKLCDHLVYIYQ